MSASFIRLHNDKSKCTISYYFHQTKPIPSYAVVIAVGFLRKAAINSRIYIFAEDKFFQKSIKTFANIDSMLLAAENLCGPYIFGKIFIHSLLNLYIF